MPSRHLPAHGPGGARPGLPGRLLSSSAIRRLQLRLDLGSDIHRVAVESEAGGMERDENALDVGRDEARHFASVERVEDRELRVTRVLRLMP